MIAALHAGLTGLAGLLGLMALAGSGFAVAAAALVGRYAGPDAESALPPMAGPAPATVALLKPLHGAEPNLASNLAGFLRQGYAGAVTIWLGVQDAADGALPAARALADAHPDRVRLVLDPRRRGANAKIANIMNLAEVEAQVECGAGRGAGAVAGCGQGAAGLVVLTDSDIAVGRGWLAAVVATLERPRAGLVTCLYAGRAAAPTRAARLGAMGVSYGFLPQGAVGTALGARPSMGSTLALRRETLEAIGGFAAVKDVLADDYELGRAVRGLGLEVVAAPVLVTHDSAEASLGELWRHELRWARTIRGLDPTGYAGSVVTHAGPLALLCLALCGGAWWGWAALAAAMAARLWLKGRVDRVVGESAGPWWLMPVRDMLSLAVFAAAWFAVRVDWRGSRFHVGRDGGLTPV